MTTRQLTAIENHCRLAGEVVNLRFVSLLYGGLSLVLTVNSGYE